MATCEGTGSTRPLYGDARDIFPLDENEVANLTSDEDFAYQLTLSVEGREEILGLRDLILNLRLKCQQFEEERNYSAASDANKELKAAEKQFTTLYENQIEIWEKQHHSEMKTRYKQAKTQLAQDWKLKMTAFELRVAEGKQTLQEEHCAELKTLHASFSKEISRSLKHRVSTEVLLRLKAHEQLLVKQKRYEEAESVKKQADSLENDTEREIREQLRIEQKNRLLRLQQRHHSTANQFDVKSNAARADLIRIQKYDFQKLEERFEKALHRESAFFQRLRLRMFRSSLSST